MKNITYDQIAKNTVKAENQLKNSKYITFENPEGKGLRVLFHVGARTAIDFPREYSR